MDDCGGEIEIEYDGAWLSAKAAVQFLLPIYPKEADAQATLVRRAIAALVETRCARVRVEYKINTKSDKEEDNCRLQPIFWKRYEETKAMRRGDWVAGDFTSRRFIAGISSQSSEVIYAQAYGVEFREDQLRALVISTTTPAESRTDQRDRGAPKKDFWEDLWAEIAAQLATNELSASKAAVVERAMLAWAEENRHSLSESTAKLRAAKLMTLIRKKADK